MKNARSQSSDTHLRFRLSGLEIQFGGKGLLMIAAGVAAILMAIAR